MPAVATCPTPARSRSIAKANLAIVAPGDIRENLFGNLAGEGFSTCSLDTVEALLALDRRACPTTVVLWAGDGATAATPAMAALTAPFRRLAVILVSPTIQRSELRLALTAGVKGVVLRDDVKRGLGACLRAVQAGQICVPRGHWREIEPAALSPREKEVLGLVAIGCQNRQIAERLFLAESTVKSHLSSAFDKLGVRSRIEAADLILTGAQGLTVTIPTPQSTPDAPARTAAL